MEKYIVPSFFIPGRKDTQKPGFFTKILSCSQQIR
jgi:hypothetical protein